MWTGPKVVKEHCENKVVFGGNWRRVPHLVRQLAGRAPLFTGDIFLCQWGLDTYTYLCL
jgi:hypothetical protein